MNFPIHSNASFVDIKKNPQCIWHTFTHYTSTIHKLTNICTAGKKNHHKITPKWKFDIAVCDKTENTEKITKDAVFEKCLKTASQTMLSGWRHHIIWITQKVLFFKNIFHFSNPPGDILKLVGLRWTRKKRDIFFFLLHHGFNPPPLPPLLFSLCVSLFKLT